MKKTPIAKGGIAAIAAVAFTLGACKKAPESTGGTDGSESAAPGSTANSEVAKKSGGSVAKQLDGYWTMQKEALLAMMKKELAGEGGEIDAAALEMANMMVGQMAEKFALHLDGEKSTAVSPDGIEEGTFKVTSSDPATGAFTAEMTEGDGNTDSGNGTISGDTMTMSKDGIEMTLVRISKAEFEKRKAAATNPAPGGGFLPGPSE